jgi:bifunctional DNA-binding transcriptional regulator/antitoxin component of YhaV-PrlF toxin-antitoxin module
MTVAMDKFGRILIPKKLREELHLYPDEPLDLEIENGTLRVSIAPQNVELRKKGHILVADSQPLEDSSDILEAIRDERLEELANW